MSNGQQQTPQALGPLDDWQRSGLAVPEVERDLMGMLLEDAMWPEHLGRGFLEEVAGILQPPDFFDDVCRYTYDALLRLAGEGLRGDWLLLEPEMRRAGYEGLMTDAYSLTSAAKDGTSRVRLRKLTELVRTAAAKRASALLNLKLAHAATDREADPDTLLAQGEEAYRTLRERYGRRTGAADDTAANVVADYRALVEHWRATPGALRGTTTGIHAMDDATKGIHLGDLWLIGARMSGGKTALMLSMALAALRACAEGHQVGIVSLEMDKKALMHRLAAMLSGQSATAIEDGDESVDWDRLDAALDELEQLPLRIIDAQGANRRTNGARGKMTTEEIARYARAWRQAGVLDALYVDYLELIRAGEEERKLSRDLQLGAYANSLKGLASELQMPLVLLSQLNRENEKTASHVPQLGNIRYSDEPAAAADVVLFPVWWDYWRDRGLEVPKDAEAKPKGAVDLWIAKQRNRAVKMVPAFFLRERMQIVDYDEYRRCPVDYHGRVIPRPIVQGQSGVA